MLTMYQCGACNHNYTCHMSPNVKCPKCGSGLKSKIVIYRPELDHLYRGVYDSPKLGVNPMDKFVKFISDNHIPLQSIGGTMVVASSSQKLFSNQSRTKWFIENMKRIVFFKNDLNLVKLSSSKMLLYTGNLSESEPETEILRIDLSDDFYNDLAIDIIKSKFANICEEKLSLEILLKGIKEYVEAIFYNKNLSVFKQKIQQLLYNQNFDQLPSISNNGSGRLGFVLDLRELIKAGTGVCRHINITIGITLARIIWCCVYKDSSYTLLRKHCDWFFNSHSTLFSHSDAVEFKGADLVNPWKFESVLGHNKKSQRNIGGHGYCVLYMFPASGLSNNKVGPWIIDGMWNKIINLTAPGALNQALQPQFGDYTYGMEAVRPILASYKFYGLSNKTFNGKIDDDYMSPKAPHISSVPPTIFEKKCTCSVRLFYVEDGESPNDIPPNEHHKDCPLYIKGQ